MQGTVDARSDGVVGGSKLELAVASIRVLVNGEVPLLHIPPVAQAAQRPLCVVYVAESSTDESLQLWVIEAQQFESQMLQRLRRDWLLPFLLLAFARRGLGG